MHENWKIRKQWLLTGSFVAPAWEVQSVSTAVMVATAERFTSKNHTFITNRENNLPWFQKEVALALRESSPPLLCDHVMLSQWNQKSVLSCNGLLSGEEADLSYSPLPRCLSVESWNSTNYPESSGRRGSRCGTRSTVECWSECFIGKRSCRPSFPFQFCAGDRHVFTKLTNFNCELPVFSLNDTWIYFAFLTPTLLRSEVKIHLQWALKMFLQYLRLFLNVFPI